MSERSDPLLNGSQKITHCGLKLKIEANEIELQILFTNKVFPFLLHFYENVFALKKFSCQNRSR